MNSSLLSPRTLQIANEVMDWAKTYLATDHPEMKRPGGSKVICPFVKPSIDNDSFYMAFHEEINGESEEHIEAVLLGYIQPFKQMPPFGTEDKLKKALLVIFPNLPPKWTPILDIAHANIKSHFVETGLMVGQFHQNCDERSTHNRALRVSVSPHPLVAIRHMAIHDILFLGDDEKWFRVYNVRYGHRFNEPETLEDYNKPLLDNYQRAKDRFQR